MMFVEMLKYQYCFIQQIVKLKKKVTGIANAKINSIANNIVIQFVNSKVNSIVNSKY